MMRLKRAASMSGKWRDIDNVFTYIASGSGDFVINGNRYTLHKGDAIIIPPFQTHLIVSQGSEPLVQYIMHFDFYETSERRKLAHKDVLDAAEAEIVIPEREQLLEQSVIIAHIPESERNEMMRSYLALMREFEDNRPGRGMYLKAGCILILVQMLRNSTSTEEYLQDTDNHRAKAWMHIERAIDYINTRSVKEELGNESIAEAIQVTPNYLTHIFQEYIGMSLHKYIINCRIEKAQMLLLSGKKNITETAEETGFSSIHVFSKTFKNLIGISPTAFLDENVSREQLTVNMPVDPAGLLARQEKNISYAEEREHVD
jgi:AraC-like DNA-binding protein